MFKNIDYKSNKGAYVFVTLDIAYSVDIGDIGTLVGNPSNATVTSQPKASFSEWLQYGVSTVLGLMPLVSGTMYLIFRPKLNIKITPGVTTDKLNSKRYITTLIFAVTALCWIFGDTLNV